MFQIRVRDSFLGIYVMLDNKCLSISHRIILQYWTFCRSFVRPFMVWSRQRRTRVGRKWSWRLIHLWSWRGLQILKSSRLGSHLSRSPGMNDNIKNIFESQMILRLYLIEFYSDNALFSLFLKSGRWGWLRVFRKTAIGDIIFCPQLLRRVW